MVSKTVDLAVVANGMKNTNAFWTHELLVTVSMAAS